MRFLSVENDNPKGDEKNIYTIHTLCGMVDFCGLKWNKMGER
jgi:hypothetical protein